MDTNDLNGMDHYCCPPRFHREPPFVRQLRRETGRRGSLSEAMAQMFTGGRVVVDVCGGTDAWQRTGTGTLLVGDHRQRFEFAALLSALGQAGRTDVHLFAKPFSRNARIIHSAGLHAQGVILPVFPRRFAADRHHVLDRDLLRRLAIGDGLPTEGELRLLNDRILRRASASLEAGRLVTLFPCGAVVDARRSTWHRGLGTIVKQVAPARRSAVAVVLFRFDDFSATRIVHRLNLHARGVVPRRPYRIRLRVRALGQIDDVFGDAALRCLTAEEVTQRLRRRFIQSFEAGSRGN